MKKDLLTLLDLEKEDFDHLIQRAIELKNRKKQKISDMPLAGKTLGLVFEKPSTRTRISFEAAMAQLGGTPIFISTKDTQMSRKEPIKDTAKVLSRYLDAIAIRTFSQEIIEEFAANSTVPIINALTDRYHPCQVLSDLMTIVEFKGDCTRLKIAWFGDGNNVAHSWINASAVMGLNLVLACPDSYRPQPEILETAQKMTSGSIRVVSDPWDAAKDADVIYTDVWASMGQEDEQKIRKQVFAPFQVNSALLKSASPKAIVMHCLPAHVGEEITQNAIDSPGSVVWDQSENKLHMHKAILETLLV